LNPGNSEETTTQSQPKLATIDHLSFAESRYRRRNINGLMSKRRPCMPLTVPLNWRPCTRGWKSSKRRFGHQDRLIAAEEALKEAEGLEAELKTNFGENLRLEPQRVGPV
jgi:hypothetical protein